MRITVHRTVPLELEGSVDELAMLILTMAALDTIMPTESPPPPYAVNWGEEPPLVTPEPPMPPPPSVSDVERAVAEAGPAQPMPTPEPPPNDLLSLLAETGKLIRKGVCPECRKKFSPRGLSKHRSSKHGIEAPSTVSRANPTKRAAPAVETDETVVRKVKALRKRGFSQDLIADQLTLSQSVVSRILKLHPVNPDIQPLDAPESKPGKSGRPIALDVQQTRLVGNMYKAGSSTPQIVETLSADGINISVNAVISALARLGIPRRDRSAAAGAAQLRPEVREHHRVAEVTRLAAKKGPPTPAPPPGPKKAAAFRCDEHNLTFPNGQGLGAHNRHQHPKVTPAAPDWKPETSKAFRCPTCERVFADEFSLKGHVRREHGAGETSPKVGGSAKRKLSVELMVEAMDALVAGQSQMDFYRERGMVISVLLWNALIRGMSDLVAGTPDKPFGAWPKLNAEEKLAIAQRALEARGGK